MPGTFTYTQAAGTVLGAGNNETLSVSFTPTDTTDYASTQCAQRRSMFFKAAPTIAWASPANIVYGTAPRHPVGRHGILDDGRDHGERAGNIHLHTGRGHSAGRGNNETLSVSFTPTDTTDYASTGATTTINVLQATPTITWANPANIVVETPLSSTQLDATSSWTVAGVSTSVAGTFSYNPGAGTLLSAGAGQSLSVTFTPIDTTDYTAASASVQINVTAAATATATFLNENATTQGNWVGVYGSQGYNVLGSGAVNPTYATVTPSGQSLYTYATPAPTVTQALEVPPPGTTRVAAVWYSGSSFTIDVNVASGHTYDLELYFLDYDARGRSETVTLTDAKTSALLNTQTVSSFANGEYLSWAISGNVLITVTTLTGASASAVVSGLFFDPVGTLPAAPPPPPSSILLLQPRASSVRTRRRKATGSAFTAARDTTCLAAGRSIPPTRPSRHRVSRSTPMRPRFRRLRRGLRFRRRARLALRRCGIPARASRST